MNYRHDEALWMRGKVSVQSEVLDNYYNIMEIRLHLQAVMFWKWWTEIKCLGGVSQMDERQG
jgi:hypothetical protein